MSSAVYRSPSNRNFVLLATSACTGTLIGLACAFFFLKFRKKSFDFARLSDDIKAMKRDLANLRDTVEQLRSATEEGVGVKFKENRSASRGNEQNREKSIFSSMSQASVEAYFDAASSMSDSDNELELLKKQRAVEEKNVSEENSDFKTPLMQILDKTDELQGKGSDEARALAYQILQANYLTGKSNYEYLWRFAMACYLYGQTFLNRDKAKRRGLCLEAQRYAFEALAIKEDHPDVQKWCALTLGVMSDFVGMKQKIEDGHKFKAHIDRALCLKPDDAVLHHLCGRWCFGVACLSWFERQVATTLFAKPPTATYDDALNCFLEADRLKPNWLENILYITKVFLAKNDAEHIRQWIKKARTVKQVTADDVASMNEMSTILSKFT